jgi:uncharacterized protein (TIGR02145 family)
MKYTDMKMKSNIRRYLTLALGLGLVLMLNNCKKKEEATSGTIKDIDGNVYTSVTIGTQIWMVENLKTTKNNDGSSIPNVSDALAWTTLTTPAYCWYNNDASTYKATYGALYNWYTVNLGKLCPTGWHVPTDSEWTILTTYLGGESIAGGKIKEIGTTHWETPNTGATNECGFTALPGGLLTDAGRFFMNGYYSGWWSSTENGNNAWERAVYTQENYVERSSVSKVIGFSVRCLKN